MNIRSMAGKMDIILDLLEKRKEDWRYWYCNRRCKPYRHYVPFSIPGYQELYVIKNIPPDWTLIVGAK